MSAYASRIDPNKSVDWHLLVNDDLLGVEDILTDTICSDVPTIKDAAGNLLSAGGKRLRPALIILSARAVTGTSSSARVKDIAAAVELIHMATLMHDDVIDHSDSRRGKVTANAFWGNRISILSGDYILAKAFQILARDDDKRIMDVIADTTIKICESEVLQSHCEHSVEGWRDNYWQIVRNKTAGFLSACCRCGALLAGADHATENALAEYGMEMGIAFQLTDDILDIAGEPDVTGKPIGSDLREGKLTMPVLLALDLMPDAEKKDACRLLEKPGNSEEDVRDLCNRIRSIGAIESARDLAKSLTEKANAHLLNLQSSDARDALISLSSQIIYRAK